MMCAVIGATGPIWQALAMTREATVILTLKNKPPIMIKMEIIEIYGCKADKLN
jgi:hypothetical protein